MGENIFNYRVIADGDASGNIESPIIDLSRADGFSISAVFTGTPNGTFEIQLGNTNNDLNADPDSIVPITGAGKITYEKQTNAFDKVKVVYTASSGTGTLNVQINAKGDSR